MAENSMLVSQDFQVELTSKGLKKIKIDEHTAKLA